MDDAHALRQLGELGGRKLPFSLALQEQMLDAIAAAAVCADALKRAARLCEQHPDLFRGYSPVDTPVGPIERRERRRARGLLRLLKAAAVGEPRARARKRKADGATDAARQRS